MPNSIVLDMTTLLQVSTDLGLSLRGPFDLAQVAQLGFGNGDEPAFDGVLRLPFCLDGDYERQVGVEVRQAGRSLELSLHVPSGSPPLTEADTERAVAQVARILSVEHNGTPFARLCKADPALAAAHRLAPGFRPLLFSSPYEAAVTSIISARRSRRQGLAMVARLAEESGVSIDVAGKPTRALPTPSRLLAVESAPGIPADRIPRLHAVAEAARRGELAADRLRLLPPEEAMDELQRIPGIGPFYSSLIVERACGHADVALTFNDHAGRAVSRAYGLASVDEQEFERLAESWRPFRTWVLVLLRSLLDRSEIR